MGRSDIVVDEAMKVAEGYLGVKEIIPNRSPAIDDMNRTVGAALGSYWCVSYVYKTTDKATKNSG